MTADVLPLVLRVEVFVPHVRAIELFGTHSCPASDAHSQARDSMKNQV